MSNDNDVEEVDDFDYEDEDALPFEEGDTTCAAASMPKDVNQQRLLSTLAWDAACGFLKFVVYVAKRVEEDKNWLERARMYDAQTLKIKTYQRRFLCNLEWLQPQQLRAYCMRWNIPWSPLSEVHNQSRRVEFQRLERTCDKWCTIDSELDDVNNLHPYVPMFKQLTGRNFEISVPMPSLYCVQLLVAHVALYSMQRSAGDFDPRFGCYVYIHMFAERPYMRKEARELLRALTLLGLKYNTTMSGRQGEFVSHVLCGLLSCKEITTNDVQQQLTQTADC